jgi:hypothetical protein
MVNSDIAPNFIFNQEEWLEIAKSVPLEAIPASAQSDICDALLEFEINYVETVLAKRPRPAKLLEHKALLQFIKYAKQLRLQIDSVRDTLKSAEWSDRTKRLMEDIATLQRFVEREVATRPALKGGRPTLHDRANLVSRLGVVFEQMTGRKAGRSENPKTKKLGGPFVRFVSTIFRLHSPPISLRGIKHVIDAAARNAENLA